jgi:hypothetical protein
MISLSFADVDIGSYCCGCFCLPEQGRPAEGVSAKKAVEHAIHLSTHPGERVWIAPHRSDAGLSGTDGENRVSCDGHHMRSI